MWGGDIRTHGFGVEVVRGMTQCERILRHLEDYGSITSLEAMSEYGIMRLASRVNDLRRLGYPIVTELMRYSASPTLQ